MTETMPCGHPEGCVVSGREGTNYCGRCESEARRAPGCDCISGWRKCEACSRSGYRRCERGCSGEMPTPTQAEIDLVAARAELDGLQRELEAARRAAIKEGVSGDAARAEVRHAERFLADALLDLAHTEALQESRERQIRQMEWDAAETWALVLNHEAHIATLGRAADKVQADLAAARAEVERLREEIEDWQDASGLIGGSGAGDPGSVHPEDLRARIVSDEARLTEAEGLLEEVTWALNELEAITSDFGGEHFVSARRARAALSKADDYLSRREGDH